MHEVHEKQTNSYINRRRLSFECQPKIMIAGEMVKKTGGQGNSIYPSQIDPGGQSETHQKTLP